MKTGMKVFFTFFVAAMFVITGCSKNVESQQATAASMPEVENQSGMGSAETAASTASAATNASRTASGQFKKFPIYIDGNSPDNHYTPSGWMGDYGDLSVDDKYMKNAHSGSTAIKIIYNGKAAQGARWAGIYWQNPPNNWGTRPGGYDLTGSKKMVFWARGEKGGERIEEFKIGGITGEYADSDVAGIGPVELTTEWQEFVIDLDGKDLSSISGGFAWATNLDANPEGVTFYLDDIRYE